MDLSAGGPTYHGLILPALVRIKSEPDMDD